MIIQYIKIPFSRAVFISNYKTDKNVTQNMIKEKFIPRIKTCHSMPTHSPLPPQLSPRKAPQLWSFHVNIIPGYTPAVQPNHMLCICKLMVAFVLHKTRVITLMKERRLKWGSVDAAAQVGQSVIFSTENIRQARKSHHWKTLTLDWSTNP